MTDRARIRRYVLGFAFTEDGSGVWLMEKKRPLWQNGRLNGIGGHVEDGEDPLEAVAREFQEEATLIVDRWSHFATIGGSDWIMWCYLTALPVGIEPKAATDEDIFVFPTDSPLPERAIPNLNFLIPMALRSNPDDWPYSITEASHD